MNINLQDRHKIYKSKDNAIIASFDSVIDIDLALWRYIKDKYGSSKYIDKDIINIDDENNIKFMLMDRRDKNPLSILLPDYDTEKMYNDIVTNDRMFNNILSNYATQYDTLKLFNTFIDNASSIHIDILCKNPGQADIVKKYIKSEIGVIVDTIHNILIKDYSIIQVKFFSDLKNYPTFEGRHIFIPNALYNMQDNMNTIDITCMHLFGLTNQVHLIDLYRDVKWFFTTESNDPIERKVDEELHANENKYN